MKLSCAKPSLISLPELKGETNSDRYNCYVVEKPKKKKKGCVPGNGKEIRSKKEFQYLKDLFFEIREKNLLSGRLEIEEAQ